MSPFQQASRVALKEAIVSESRSSRLGVFLSEDGLNAAIENLMVLFETSRQLRVAGDRFTQAESSAPNRRSREMR
ncbi:MAG: hypothetical protein AB8C84_10365 [Oligoflexales bacterium]